MTDAPTGRTARFDIRLTASPGEQTVGTYGLAGDVDTALTPAGGVFCTHG